MRYKRKDLESNVPWYINYRCPGSNYCGAGNRMDLPVKDNGIDWICKEHDEAKDYTYHKWHAADDIFVRRMRDAKPKDWQAVACRNIALAAFAFKKRFLSRGKGRSYDSVDLVRGLRVPKRRKVRHLDKRWVYAVQQKKKKKRSFRFK